MSLNKDEVEAMYSAESMRAAVTDSRALALTDDLIAESICVP